MEHAATSISSPVVAGSGASFTISRVFTNSSGGSITVREAGLIAENEDTTGNTRYFLIARDLTAETVVAHGQTITVEYKISVTAG